LVFLIHQTLLFLTAIVFLTSVRRLSGRSIHLGQDPVGAIDGFALVILSIAVIVFTIALYRWVKGKSAAPLGIALSFRRLVDLVAGLLIGFAFIILPYVSALLSGTATIHDRITAHFNQLTTARIIAVAFFLLLVQSVTEETANRAFPMRLWEDRPLWFRVLIPSIFFAAIHLAGEGFTFERIGILLMAGITQSLAYALTGNIWLCSGLHAGANLASFFPTGLWHAGAVVALVGHMPIPHLLMVMLMLVVVGTIFIISSTRRHRNVLALLLTLLLPAPLTAQTNSANQSLAFTHVTVIDMTGAPPRIRREWLEYEAKIIALNGKPAPPELDALQFRLIKEAMDTYNSEKAAALYKRFVLNNTYHCPTLVIHQARGSLSEPAFFDDANLRYVPLRQRWSVKTYTDAARSWSSENKMIGERLYNYRLRMVGELNRAGVKLLAGTDIGYGYPIAASLFTTNLRCLCKLDFHRWKRCKRRQSNPAKFFNRETELGTIEKGKLADLILLDADPLANISNTKKINAVVWNGHLLDRKALDKMLSEMEATASKKD
jgi:hypothetical protein